MIYASVLKRLRDHMSWFLTNRHCLICSQPSSSGICPYCVADLDCFDASQYHNNLLNYVGIRRYLKRTNFDSLLALGPYQWPLSSLITSLKFSAKTTHAKALAETFYHRQLIHTPQDRPQKLLCVPLHRQRYGARQFNQAALLTGHLSRLTGIPWCANSLIKRTPTAPQTEVSGSQRLTNLKQVFGLTRAIDCQHIALVDDVLTTGTTVSALSEVLRDQYPELRIDVWAMCVSPERQ